MAHLATSALRIPGRMQAWKSAEWGRVRAWMLRAFESNPLRQRRDAWVSRCAGLPEFEFVSYVLEHGLVVTDPRQRPAPFDLRNHGSFDDPWRGPRARAILQGEADQGFILRVSNARMRERCQWIHPLGAIPKGADKVRIIHDFSAPAGGSLNDCQDYVRLRYDKVDAAFSAMRASCFMAKIDISAFFRHVPLDPAD